MLSEAFYFLHNVRTLHVIEYNIEVSLKAGLHHTNDRKFAKRDVSGILPEAPFNFRIDSKGYRESCRIGCRMDLSFGITFAFIIFLLLLMLSPTLSNDALFRQGKLLCMMQILLTSHA